MKKIKNIIMWNCFISIIGLLVSLICAIWGDTYFFIKMAGSFIISAGFWGLWYYALTEDKSDRPDKDD